MACSACGKSRQGTGSVKQRKRAAALNAAIQGSADAMNKVVDTTNYSQRHKEYLRTLRHKG